MRRILSRIWRTSIIGNLVAGSLVVLPFVLTDIVRLAILITFPILATWLPSHM